MTTTEIYIEYTTPLGWCRLRGEFKTVRLATKGLKAARLRDPKGIYRIEKIVRTFIT